MITEIRIFVEHGDTTDPLTEYLDSLPGTNENFPNEQEGLTVLGYTVSVDTDSIPIDVLQEGMTMVGKSGDTADVYRVVHMASGIVVTLDTQFGSYERTYAPGEIVTVK